MKIISEKQVHTHGFVRLLGVFGTDEDICDSARISYSKGTRSISDDRSLIRYLLRHKHTSPLEQAEVRLGIKMPIFVMRQWIRHRTANVNEISGRYSVLDTEFYTPDILKAQSKNNKQGSGDEHPKSEHHLKHFSELQKISALYYDEMVEDDVSRELARLVLPVNVYTECVWKIDLHNLFHFLKLRTDSHAQQEIQDYANVIDALVRPHFPASFEAYDDYLKNTYTLSAMELQALNDYSNKSFINDRQAYRMTDREWKEFTHRFSFVGTK